jgi:hypothetical protein
MEVPTTILEFHEWQRLGRFRTIREDCGFRGRTISLALGINRSGVFEWELRWLPSTSILWERYMRVIRALMNHLEVPEDRCTCACSGGICLSDLSFLKLTIYISCFSSKSEV